MRVGALGRDAAARGARKESLLQQVRLVNLIDRVGLFSDSGREALDPDRSAVKLVDDRAEDRAIHLIEACRIDFEQLQSGQRDLARDDRRFINLREVPHAAQQSIGDSRRPARSRSELVRTIFVNLHFKQRRGAADYLPQFRMIVKVEMKVLAETVPQRSAEKT